MKRIGFLLVAIVMLLFPQFINAVDVTIGTGDNDLCVLPVHMCFKSSITETIYYASEINTTGTLTGLTWYNTFLQPSMQKPIKIWVGETTQNNLTGGWIPSTNLSLVFEGLIDFPSGDNNIPIQFNTPYLYNGGNLVIMTLRQMDTQLYSESINGFYCSYQSVYRSRSYANDLTEPDPTNPPVTMWLMSDYPNITLHFGDDQVTVNGRIVSNSAPTAGIAGATISLSGVMTYSATTDGNGYFTVPGVMSDQTYSYMISAVNYSPITGTITVSDVDVNMGTLMLTPVINPALNVMAEEEGDFVLLTWEAPQTTDPILYNVYRLHVGEENQQSQWTLLTASALNDVTYSDNSWNTLPIGDYTWAVVALYPGNVTSEAAFSNHLSVTSANDDSSIAMNPSLLIGNYPNPFNPSTIIRFAVRETSPVSLSIYDLKGKKIRTLIEAKVASGEHSIEWDGKDDNFKPVASGVYFYKMKSGSFSSTKKMILMK